jgi:hypothetical protein
VCDVLHHLPLRYRVAVWIAGLVAFAGVGAWVAFATQVPLAWQSGFALGFALGVLAVASFLRAMEGAAEEHPDGSREVA